MWDFSIGRSLSIMMRTWPFIIFRMIVYFGITVAYIMATGTGASVGYGVGHISTDPDGPMSFALWGGVVGLGARHHRGDDRTRQLHRHPGWAGGCPRNSARYRRIADWCDRL